MSATQMEFADLDMTGEGNWCRLAPELRQRAEEIKRQNLELLRQKKWPEKSLRMSERPEIETYLVKGLME